jgi:hypothetical protein
VETTLAAQRREVVEILGDGKHALVLHHGILPNAASEAISRRLAALELEFAPERRWWRDHTYELDVLRAERQNLLESYRRLDRWQSAALSLVFTFEAIHGVLALAVTANMIKLALTGGSAIAFGGTCAGVLRYLAKERATTMNRLAQINDSAAKLHAMAEPMVILPQFASQSENKFKAITDMYKKK